MRRAAKSGSGRSTARRKSTVSRTVQRRSLTVIGKGGRLAWRADIMRDQDDRDLLAEVVLIHRVPPEVLPCGPGDCQFIQLLEVCKVLANS